MEKLKRSVLVIDDVSEHLRSVKAILENHYIVRLAKSGELAISILNSTPVDVILLDIEMPNISGFKFLGWLKKNTATRHIPVIFISSHSEAQIVQHAAQLDIKGYVKKPVDPQLLLAKIREAF